MIRKTQDKPTFLTMSLEKATKEEMDHMAEVKSLPCGVCNDFPPSLAHHIKEGDRRVSHFATIPLCFDCHQGPNGIHGDKAFWRIYKKSELSVLAETNQKLRQIWKSRKQ